MSKIYRQPGTIVPFFNHTEHLIASNDVVVLHDRVGVALAHIPPQSTGSVTMEGVFELPKALGALFQGQSVCWDDLLQKVVLAEEASGAEKHSAKSKAPTSTEKTNTAAHDKRSVPVALGYVFMNAEVTSETVQVKLNA